MQRFPYLAICVHLTAFLILATLIALGVYVNKNNILIGTLATQGYLVINVDTTYWNVGCNLVGTFVGILATAAFSIQDGAITCQELYGNNGVLALFLRPLTMKRGLDQLLCLQLPFIRAILLLATAVAALTSAATVAIFGVHATTTTIINPAASYSLAALSGTFFFSDRDGAVFVAGSPARSSFVSQLSGFAYKSAYITGLKIKDKYDAELLSLDGEYLPEQGMLGDNQYATLSTGGIGLNTSSYIQYSGYPNGFDLPAEYDFKGLNGSVYGTNVSVECRNITSHFRHNLTSLYEPDDIQLLRISRPGGPNFSFARFFESGSSLALIPSIQVDAVTGEPSLVIAVVGDLISDLPLVLDCHYRATEYIAQVSLDSPISPLRIDHTLAIGTSFGPLVQQRMSNVGRNVIRSGIITRGLIDAGFDGLHGNIPDMGSCLETVLENVSEAHIALMRQSVERTNAYKTGANSGAGTVSLSIVVSRLGGGQYAWLSVLSILLLSVSMGVVREWVKSTDVGIDAQDAVELLNKTLDDENVTPLSRFMGTKEGTLIHWCP